MFSGIFSSLVSGRHVSCFVVDSSSGPVGTSRLESHMAITAFTSLETTGREMPAFSAVSQRAQIAIIRFLLNGILLLLLQWSDTKGTYTWMSSLAEQSIFVYCGSHAGETDHFPNDSRMF